jgi:hypothetical protein
MGSWCDEIPYARLSVDESEISKRAILRSADVSRNCDIRCVISSNGVNGSRDQEHRVLVQGSMQ